MGLVLPPFKVICPAEAHNVLLKCVSKPILHLPMLRNLLLGRMKSKGNIILASCPWGPVTANGVDLLTEMYVIYMETVGPLGAAGAGVTYAWNEGRKES